MDPRAYQIAALCGLLIYGWVRLDFEVGLPQAAVCIGSALVAQAVGTRVWRLPRFEYRSALISGLSLCLLLRTDHLALAAAAGAVAIGGKFLLRWRGKHLFNPTNLGLVTLMLASDGRVWVSPGQWGSVAFIAFLLVCAGGLVVMRAARADVTLSFLAAYVGLVLGRALWLGDPIAIPLHRLQSGALLIFAFFMISDPRTTPDSRAGRVIFAALVATAGWWLQVHFFIQTGLLWALAAGALCVPALDRLLPGRRYQWSVSIPERPRLEPQISNLACVTS